MEALLLLRILFGLDYCKSARFKTLNCMIIGLLSLVMPHGK